MQLHKIIFSLVTTPEIIISKQKPNDNNIAYTYCTFCVFSSKQKKTSAQIEPMLIIENQSFFLKQEAWNLTSLVEYLALLSV
jgi:hypothetical protein